MSSFVRCHRCAGLTTFRSCRAIIAGIAGRPRQAPTLPWARKCLAVFALVRLIASKELRASPLAPSCRFAEHRDLTIDHCSAGVACASQANRAVATRALSADFASPLPLFVQSTSRLLVAGSSNSSINRSKVRHNPSSAQFATARENTPAAGDRSRSAETSAAVGNTSAQAAQFQQFALPGRIGRGSGVFTVLRPLPASAWSRFGSRAANRVNRCPQFFLAREIAAPAAARI